MPTPVANDRRRPMTGWTADDLPDLSGKTAIVTGANRGLGYQTALELARNGAHVLLAARDPARGTAALERLRADAPASRAELVELNVADLDSVRRFAEAFLARGEGLDLLINNAGVMAIPQRELTAEGFERQLGTNHLGHFALTGRLLPALLQRPSSRVVTVTAATATSRPPASTSTTSRVSGTTPNGRLRSVQAGQRHVRARAGPAPARCRPGRGLGRRPPRLHPEPTCSSPAPAPAGPASPPWRWAWRPVCLPSRSGREPCPSCMEPPPPTCRAASTSGPSGRVSGAATPAWWLSPPPPATRPRPPGCGGYRRS